MGMGLGLGMGMGLGLGMGEKINMIDLRIDTFQQASVDNKRSFAIRVTHIPSGISVLCDSEPGPHENEVKAIDLLSLRLEK